MYYLPTRDHLFYKRAGINYSQLQLRSLFLRTSHVFNANSIRNEMVTKTVTLSALPLALQRQIVKVTI
jgi:hypothetical protein